MPNAGTSQTQQPPVQGDVSGLCTKGPTSLPGWVHCVACRCIWGSVPPPMLCHDEPEALPSPRKACPLCGAPRVPALLKQNPSICPPSPLQGIPALTADLLACVGECGRYLPAEMSGVSGPRQVPPMSPSRWSECFRKALPSSGISFLSTHPLTCSWKRATLPLS